MTQSNKKFSVTHFPGYAPGHAGDPQYVEPIHYRLDFPNNFYGFTLEDFESSASVDDLLPRIKNSENTFYFTDEDGVDTKESDAFFSKFVFPKMTKVDLLKRVKKNEGSPETVVTIIDNDGEVFAKRPVKDIGTDAEFDSWVKKEVKKHFDAYIANDSNWEVRDFDDYMSASASNEIQSLEVLMERLEKMGMEKQASEVREIAGSFMGQDDPYIRRRWRPSDIAGSPGSSHRPGYTMDPSEKFLRRGESYTSLNPQTGNEAPAIYGEPAKSTLEGITTPAMLIPYLQRARKKFSDPEDLAALDRIINKVKSGFFNRTSATENKHWLDPQYKNLSVPPSQGTPGGTMGVDKTENFLLRCLQTSSGSERAVIQRLLDVYRKTHIRTASHMMLKCASSLHDKGYDTIADRLEKIAAGIYVPGKRWERGVRVKSMSEYISDSKGKGSKDVSLFDEMYDKYSRVFEGASAIVKKAKVESHSLKDIEDAITIVVKADQLMMQKLLEIGEIINL